MKTNCPHCSNQIDIDAGMLDSFHGKTHFPCPSCSGAVPLPSLADLLAVAPLKTETDIQYPEEPNAPDEAPTSSRAHWRVMNRKLLVLGSAALLVLGGLVFFLATRESSNKESTEKMILQHTELNEYFRRLIDQGTATEKDLMSISGIETYRDCYIGLTKEALPWNEAESLAKRVGGSILDLSKLGTARKEIINWLGRAHPDTLGKTTWILDGAEPLGIDSPDFGPVSTLERSRRAFVFWPGTMPTGWQWAIQPLYDEVMPFEEGVARVRVGDRWGIIDKNGKEIQAPAFTEIGTFSKHGYAKVWSYAKVGLIDVTGGLLTKVEWDDVQDQIHGFIPVKRDRKWGYLDATGKLAIPCEWDDAWRFSAEGFAVVTLARKRGIIDRSGKVIIQPVWDGALNFCKEGIGAVRRDEGWALVNTTGKQLCEPVWQVWLHGNQLGWDDRRFDLGFIPVSGESGYTLLGTDGKPLISGRFTGFQRCKAGAILTGADGASVLIGNGGKELLKFRGKASPAAEGLLRVATENEFGFLGDDGTWKIPVRRGQARDFVEGLAAFSSNGKWGFMDSAGKVVVPEEWEEVRDFSEGCAAVRQKNEWGFVNRSGAVIVLPQWELVGRFQSGRAAVLNKNSLPVTSDNVKLMSLSNQGDLNALYRIRRLSDSEQSRIWDEWSTYQNALQTLSWQFINRIGETVFQVGMDDRIKGNSSPPVFKNGTISIYRRGEGAVSLDTEGTVINGPFGLESRSGVSITRVQKVKSYDSRFGRSGQAYELRNTLGVTVIPDVNPKADFNADRIPFATPPKFGLKSASGRTLAEPQWDEAEVLSPDWVWFRIGRKCGLADGAGKIVIGARWDEIEILPLDSASLGEDGKLVMNPWGTPIYSPWIRARDGHKTIILRRTGEPAIPDRMACVEYMDFYGPDHLVVRETGSGDEPLWSLYEPATGSKTPFPEASGLRWNWIIAHWDLLWMRHKTSGKWHLMNIAGKDLGHIQDAMPLSWTLRSDGTGTVQQPGGGMYLIDAHGSRLGEAAWSQIRSFSGIRAAVEKDGKWGFISNTGAIICEPKWDEVRDYWRGMAAVRKGNQWGFIDLAGNLAVQPVWDAVLDFEQPLALDPSDRGIQYAKVMIKKKWAAIAPSGFLLLDPKYGEILAIEDPAVIEACKKYKIERISAQPPAATIMKPRRELKLPSKVYMPRITVDDPKWGYAKLTSGPPR